MVAVLLSTYNGEMYLRQQIDSLLNQTYIEWHLFIRDDGSKDGTLQIIHEYRERYPSKITFFESIIGNLGCGESFMKLLENADADYYMFCDQDDVWMPFKIEVTLKKILSLENTHGKETPIGVFTDLTVVDENLNVMMPSLWKGDNRHPEYSRNLYKQWINRHATYGCTMMINESAKSILFPYHQFEGIQGAHDTWIEYILIAKGIYDYLYTPTIYYRQHSSNVIGGKFGITEKEEIKSFLKHPSDLYRKLKKDYKRVKSMPFKMSFKKVLFMRLYQGMVTIISNI